MIATMPTRRVALRVALAMPLAGFASIPVRAGGQPVVTVWHNSGCLCCEGWIRHMRRAGFSVTAHPTDDMASIKQAHGVPDALQSCHTAIVDGYVIEGHVAESDVTRLLAERPRAVGLAAPGMPSSAPGMDQPGEPYVVMLFGTSAGAEIYARH